MTLRLVLVGLVASLGLELPTPDDLTTWTCAGRSWWNERLAEWDAGMPDDVRAFAPDEAPPPSPATDPPPLVAAEEPARAVESPEAIVADLAFEAVVNEMVEGFGADLTPAPAPAMTPAPVEAAPAIAFAPLPVAEDLYPGEAFALNRQAEGLDDALPEAVAAVAASQPALPEPTVAATAPDDSTEKLVAAVRLTRQAARAWMTLLQGPATISLRR